MTFYELVKFGKWISAYAWFRIVYRGAGLANQYYPGNPNFDESNDRIENQITRKSKMNSI